MNDNNLKFAEKDHIFELATSLLYGTSFQLSGTSQTHNTNTCTKL